MTAKLFYDTFLADFPSSFYLEKRFVLTRAIYGIAILFGFCSYKTVMCFMRAFECACCEY